MSSGSSFSDDGSVTTSTSNASRKRSSASSNQGPHRSVVDYDTEEQLREALLSFLNDDDEDTCRDCSSQLTSLLSEIQEGQPVQKVGFINCFATVFAIVCHFFHSQPYSLRMRPIDGVFRWLERGNYKQSYQAGLTGYCPPLTLKQQLHNPYMMS
jgi:hypothetical protein